MTHSIAILGASGYTGAELIRLIATHPSMKISALSADRKAGMEMADVFPHLRHLPPGRPRRRFLRSAAPQLQQRQWQ
jgi:N-acetyl-gamma-glutamylphosphate reductase